LAAQIAQGASSVLVGPTIGSGRRQSSVLSSGFSCRCTRFSLSIVPLRLSCRTSTRRQSSHDNFKANLVARDRQAVIEMNDSRRLDAFTVHVNQSAYDGSSCLRSRFEESREPQPFVDSK
jgi:hypothetical protein